VIERVTVGATVLMASLATGAGLVRWAVSPAPARARGWRTTNPARHRAAHRLPSEEVLCGPPSGYTAVDPNAETQAFGVVHTGFGWCSSCWDITPGVITRNGFRCDSFTQHAGGAR
jgi:hypothetical protein